MGLIMQGNPPIGKFGPILFSGLLVMSGFLVIPHQIGAKPESCNARSESWIINDLGRPSPDIDVFGLDDLTIGDLDCDGASEIYVNCWSDAHVYRFVGRNNSWEVDDIGQLLANSRGNSIEIGDADDDGHDELYAGAYLTRDRNYVYQLRKGEAGWEKDLLGATGNTSNGFAIGDGNNDDRNELFSSDVDSHVYMFYKAQTWNCQDIGNGSEYQSDYAIMRGIAVGDGDNDGKNEVYASNNDGLTFRAEYSGYGWNWTEIDRHKNTALSDLALGDADNDGKDEICVLTVGTNTSTIMYKWNCSSKSWDGVVMTGYLPSYGTGDYRICIGDGNGNGWNEVYVSMGYYLYQLSFINGTWMSTYLGSANAGIMSLATGSAAGDPNQKEIYAACNDGHLYQFYNDVFPPANPSVRSDTHPVPGTWYNQGRVRMLWDLPPFDISGIKGYSIMWDTSPTTVPREHINVTGNVSEFLGPRLRDGSGWYFHIRACDNSGNWNDSATTFGPVCIDTKAPSGLSLRIGDGSGYANDALVALSPDAPDPQPGSGTGWMAFSNDGTFWTDWLPYDSALSGWNLTDYRFGGEDTDGPKTVYFKARDVAGNEVTAENRTAATVFLDRRAPDGLGIAINDGSEWTNKADVTLLVRASDPEPASGLWRLGLSNDGVSWSGWTDWAGTAAWSLAEGAGGADSDGLKTVHLRVMDRAGNIAGPASATIFLDQRPPGQLGLLINDGAGFTNVSEVSLAVHVVDPEPGSAGLEMAFSNDGSEYGPWEPMAELRGNWSLVTGAGGKDSDGNKTVRMMTRDAAGNLGGPVNASIFLDRVRPERLAIAINGGARYATRPDVDLSLAAEDAEPSSGLRAMQFSRDGTVWTEWEQFSPCRTYHLDGPDGPRTLHFKVKDRAGNIGGEGTATIILDTTAPFLTGVVASGITPRSAVIMWQTDEEADGAVDYGPTGAYGMSAANGTFVTSHSILLTGLLPATTYHFRVTSKDAAGNGPARSSDITFTTTSKDDFVPPMISDVKVLGLSDRTAVIGWRTSEPADGLVEWGPTEAYGMSGRDSRLVLVHSLTLGGLSPSTAYHFRVASSDSSGNGPSFSPDFTFTTLARPDTTPPVISDVTIVAFSDRQAVISWLTDEAADTVVEYGTDQGYGKRAVDRALVLSHQLILSGLAPSTTYHFRVHATDAAGNGPVTSPDFAFTTLALPDTTPPVISGVKVLDLTGTSALVCWDTDEASTGLLELGTDASYGISVEDGAFTTRHALLLQNLTPGRTYHFRVYSTDLSGNRAGPTGDATFTAPSEPPAPGVARLGPLDLVMAAALLALAAAGAALISRSRGRAGRGRTD
ncbi:MAG: hypothetical protein FJ149_05635 [Euryarchaeota archaeon]|nr:hypothetical protein [Euryarchaeota archaeon]